jgi:hypothetical protein
MDRPFQPKIRKLRVCNQELPKIITIAGCPKQSECRESWHPAEVSQPIEVCLQSKFVIVDKDFSMKAVSSLVVAGVGLRTFKADCWII